MYCVCVWGKGVWVCVGDVWGYGCVWEVWEVCGDVGVCVGAQGD